jgi:glycosyltransferase involved in cell wall biosynthesis
VSHHPQPDERAKRRVLLLIDRLENGGAERQFCELVRALARDGRFELTAGILDARPSVYEWALEGLGVPMLRFGREGRLRTKALRALLAELRRGRHDLIHAWKPLACDYAAIAGRLRGVPVVASSIRNAKDRDWMQFLRIRLHALLADRLVANSQAGLSGRFSRRPARFVVIRNGIDLARFRIDPDRRRRARAALPFAAGARIVAMVASFTTKKDHATLIEAFEEVARARADAVLLLAGQGPTRPEVDARVAAAGLTDRVHFAGFVRDAEELLSVCDVSVLLTDTRVHREGVSNALLESMALGLPVIATRGGGTDEVVEHGVSGLLVPPGEPAAVAGALLELLGDEEKRRRLGEGARRRVESDFGLDRFVAEHVRLYEEVLSESAGRGSPR